MVSMGRLQCEMCARAVVVSAPVSHQLTFESLVVQQSALETKGHLIETIEYTKQLIQDSSWMRAEDAELCLPVAICTPDRTVHTTLCPCCANCL